MFFDSLYVTAGKNWDEDTWKWLVSEGYPWGDEVWKIGMRESRRTPIWEWLTYYTSGPEVHKSDPVPSTITSCKDLPPIPPGSSLGNSFSIFQEAVEYRAFDHWKILDEKGCPWKSHAETVNKAFSVAFSASRADALDWLIEKGCDFDEFESGYARWEPDAKMALWEVAFDSRKSDLLDFMKRRGKIPNFSLIIKSSTPELWYPSFTFVLSPKLIMGIDDVVGDPYGDGDGERNGAIRWTLVVTAEKIRGRSVFAWLSANRFPAKIYTGAIERFADGCRACLRATLECLIREQERREGQGDVQDEDERRTMELCSTFLDYFIDANRKEGEILEYNCYTRLTNRLASSEDHDKVAYLQEYSLGSSENEEDGEESDSSSRSSSSSDDRNGIIGMFSTVASVSR